MVKIAIYADDSTLLLHDEYDVQYALHIVEEFSKFSGLVLNKNKTEALMIGKETPDSTNGIKWISKESYIKILGVYFNSTERISNIEKKLEWKI